MAFTKKNIDQITIKSGSPLKAALEIINQNSMQICFVTDSSMRLIGSLSDGDIRRALLKGATVASKIDDFMCDTPRFLIDGVSHSAIVQEMKRLQIKVIPIVEPESHQIVKIVHLDEELGIARKKNPVVLMAGGQGLRLRPLTLDTPKPLLKIGGVPILERILIDFANMGFHKFYISVNYLGDQIVDYFGSGERFGIEIEYIVETKRMGTCGALCYLKDKINNDFIVMNGDILTEFNYGEALRHFEEVEADAMMCAKEYVVEIPYGALKIEGGKLLEIHEKPKDVFHINAGIYILKPMVLNYIPQGEYFDMPTLFNKLIEDGKIVVPYVFSSYWSDVGNVDDFKNAELYVNGRQ